MRLVFRLLSLLTTLVVLLVGLAVWRLNRGPISLDFLTPRIEAALREAAPAAQIDIGSTELVWDRERHQIDLSGKQVRLGSGPQSFTIPSVAFSLEIGALLRGHVSVSTIELVGPSLRLVRDSGGQIGLGVEGQGGGGNDALAALFSPSPEGSSNLNIHEIGVRDGDLAIDDRASGQMWSLDHFDLQLVRNADGVEGEAKGDVDLAPLLGPPRAGAAASVAHMVVRAAFRHEADQLEVQDIAIDLADASVQGKGRVDGVRGGSPSFSLEAKMPLFPVDALARYWPPTAVPSARSWVTSNITSGKVKDTQLRLSAKAPAGAGLEVSSLQGSTRFEGLSVRYLDTMPRVTAVSGAATVSLAGGAVFDVTQGQLEDIAVTRAKVSLPVGREARIIIDADVGGPVNSVVNVLANPPVELTRRIGLTPREGSVSGTVGFAFPLRDGLRYEDLGMTVKAEVRGAAVDRVAGDLNWTGSDGTISIRGKSVEIVADGRLQGVPLHADLRDTIDDRNSLRVYVRGDVDAAGWKNLGIDLGTSVVGTSAVTASITAGERNTIALEARADLARTIIDLPGPLPSKIKDIPGTATARLHFSGGSLTAVENFDLDFAGNQIDATASRAGSGWTTLHSRAIFAPTRSGDNSGQLSLDVERGGSFRLVSSDAGSLLGSLGRYDGKRGSLSLQGTVALNQAGLPFDARLLLTDFTLTGSPVLSQIFRLGSVSGLMSLMTREGLRFEKSSATLSHRGGALALADGLARSTSVAVMTAGRFDLTAGTLDLSGRVIPSYFGLNEGIAEVPFFGRLLTGNDAKAVQAIDYSATGPIGDPQVKINALSSLTPQALQDLWRHIARW